MQLYHVAISDYPKSYPPDLISSIYDMAPKPSVGIYRTTLTFM